MYIYVYTIQAQRGRGWGQLDGKDLLIQALLYTDDKVIFAEDK